MFSLELKTSPLVVYCFKIFNLNSWAGGGGGRFNILLGLYNICNNNIIIDNLIITNYRRRRKKEEEY